ncbi:MAG: hypothetical protein LQ338_001166 [Usnochroma carphineum]|nr:MAG: hypothetical protein LQ338_001166 [Usnochroma carphineum]
MDAQDDANSNNWAHQMPSRPSSNVSYNPYGPSNSSSPAHGNTPIPQYQSPYGATFNQMSERQRMLYELTHQNRQNVASRPPTNGGGLHPYPQYSGHPANHPFQPNNIPHLPPPDGLNERQRYARELITQLEADKKMLLENRKETAAKIKSLQAELDGLEANQRGQEFLRFIYPVQAELANVQGVHDGYGREWVHVEELLELCWAELMVPHDNS